MTIRTVELDEVRKMWRMASEFSTIPNRDEFSRYREGDVIDEDKSVRWNREEVERRNAAYSAEAAHLREAHGVLVDQAKKSSIDYIQSEYKFNVAQATFLWSFLTGKYILNDVLNFYLDEYADMVKHMIRLEKEGE